MGLGWRSIIFSRIHSKEILKTLRDPSKRKGENARRRGRSRRSHSASPLKAIFIYIMCPTFCMENMESGLCSRWTQKPPLVLQLLNLLVFCLQL